MKPVPAQDRELQKATFAGGCFWCIEYAFDHTEGVIQRTQVISEAQKLTLITKVSQAVNRTL